MSKAGRRTPAVALLLLMVAGSCSGTGANRGGERIREPGLGSTGAAVFRSQAEAEASLARFDREHPQCQLWTNWQKMCSRTGVRGATHCSVDADRPTAPSEPFCVRPAGLPMSIEQALAHDLFCADGGAAGSGKCRLYRHDRPFNGYRLRALRSPICRRWVDAGTRATVCSEGGAGAAGCEAAAAEAVERPLACAELSEPLPCQLHPAGIVQHVESATITSDLMLMPTMVAVNGLSCLRGNRDGQ